MKIVLAKNLGFCTGVKRALFIARNSLKNDRKPVYFLGEIIHNEEVIKEIEPRVRDCAHDEGCPQTLETASHHSARESSKLPFEEKP